MTPLLSAREVSKFYGTLVGCKDVGFDIYPGKAWASLAQVGPGRPRY